MQAVPRRPASEVQLRRQAFLCLGHLVDGGLLGFAQRPGMVGGGRTCGDELVGAETCDPCCEARRERPQWRDLGLQPRLQSAGFVVAGVGGHEAVEVRADQPQLVVQLIGLREHGLERGDRRVVDGAWLARSDVVLVVERREACHACADGFVCCGELPGPERREERSQVPLRQISRRNRHGSGR